MSKPNVILMLVEGSSDETLLAPAFNALLDPTIADSDSFRCDVTTLSLFPNNAREAGLLVANDVREVVRDKVKYHLDRSDYRKADYSHITQVIDLDGAFVPNDLVIEDSSIPRIQYGTDAITVANRSQQLKIMGAKRSSVSKLLGMTTIKVGQRSIPYRLFYISRNLEHAFSNDSGYNSAQRKNRLAAELGTQYSNDPAAFRQALLALYQLHQQFRPMDVTWENSWSRITSHDSALSLQRGSNLAFLPQFVR